MYHPATIISTEMLEQAGLGEYSDYKVQLIPCQECIGCKLDYSRNWANRGYLESLYSPHNYFITLTYDDSHLPKKDRIVTSEGTIYKATTDWKGVLNPEDVEKFLDNLRHIFKRELKHTGVRFMAAGEYGEKNKRPHYHLILFNAPFPIDTFFNPRLNWKKNFYYQNKWIERAWGGIRIKDDGTLNKNSLGISNICEANWQNIAYVARYITKKINGKESEDFYAIRGQIKEFFRVSTSPGIGFQYFEDHWQEIYEKDSILIKIGKKTRWEKPPRYYDRLLEQKDPILWDKVKKNRQFEAQESLKCKLEQTSISWWEQLQIENRTKQRKAKSLSRANLDEDLEP